MKRVAALGAVLLFIALMIGNHSPENDSLQVDTVLGVQNNGLVLSIESDTELLNATERDNLGLRHWPDGLFGFDRDSVTGKECFYAGNSNGATTGIVSAPARTCGTIANPTETISYTGKNVLGVKNSDLGYLGAGPIYKDKATGMIIMFYHAEIDYNGVTSDSHGRKGVAVSKDNGMTFRDAGLILTPNIDIETARFVLGGGSYLIKDGYFYMYYRDKMQNGKQINMAVARAPISEVVSAAAKYQVTEWKKYYNGSFSEPGIGGQASLLLEANEPFRWVDFVYDTVTKQYIGIGTRSGALSSDFQSISKPSDIVYLTSTDGIKWSQRNLIMGPFTDRFFIYITIRSDSDDYKILSNDRIYAYYTDTPIPFPPNSRTMWPSASLRLLVLKVNRNSEAPPEPAPTITSENNEEELQANSFDETIASLTVSTSPVTQPNNQQAQPESTSPKEETPNVTTPALQPQAINEVLGKYCSDNTNNIISWTVCGVNKINTTLWKYYITHAIIASSVLAIFVYLFLKYRHKSHMLKIDMKKLAVMSSEIIEPGKKK